MTLERNRRRMMVESRSKRPEKGRRADKRQPRWRQMAEVAAPNRRDTLLANLVAVASALEDLQIGAPG
jgi:hypothetical protein